MDNYLVDVPVKINIWIRKSLQIKQFEVIKKAKPSILFIQSDGGRNEKENEIIRECREYIDSNIDWNCEVYRFYESENNGLYAMGSKVRNFIWEKVDRCIFLEDDDIPSVSFFEFCAQMLEKYKDDYRVQGVSGFNPLGVWDKTEADYFFSGETNPWGTATWKRSVQLLNAEDFSYHDSQYICNLIKASVSNQQYRFFMKCGKEKQVNGHVPGGEFYKGIGRITQNALFIMPKYNLISNYGCGDDAIHSNSYKTLSREEQKLYYSKAYELTFPLTHPKYMIRDTIFEKKAVRINGFGHPIVRFKRRVIKGFKILIVSGWPGLKQKIGKLRINRAEK